MPPNAVEIQLNATDSASPVINQAGVELDKYGYRIGSAMNISMRQQEEMERAIGSFKNLGEEVAATEAPMVAAGEETSRLEQRFERLTTASSYAEMGITRLQRMITGMAFGTVVGAVSALASEILNLGLHSDKARQDLDALIKEVTQEADAWDLHRQRVDKVTESTVALYNAKLVYAQFMEANEGKNIQKEIANLQERNEAIRQSLELMGNRQIIGPFVTDNKILTEELLKNNVAIEQNKVRLEDWQKLMNRLPATLNDVKNATAGVKFKDSELEQIALGKAILFVAHSSYEAQAAIDRRVTGETQHNEIEKILFEQDEERRQRKIDLMLREQKQQIALNEMVDLPSGNSATDGQRKQMEVLDALTKTNDRLSKSYQDQFDHVKALAGGYGSLAQQRIIENEAMQLGLDIQNAANSALTQFILGHEKLGPALAQATAQALASTAARAAVEALYMSAIGLVALTPWGEGIYGPAALWFEGAAVMAGIAGVAGVAARQLSNASGGRNAAIGTIGNPAVTTSSNLSGNQGNAPAPQVTVIVQALDPHAVDMQKLVSTQIGPAVADWIGRGGNTGQIKISYERR